VLKVTRSTTLSHREIHKHTFAVGKRDWSHLHSILPSRIHGGLSSALAACKLNTDQYLDVKLREEVCLVGVRATPLFDTYRRDLISRN
jgi:hypothetical protein